MGPVEVPGGKLRTDDGASIETTQTWEADVDVDGKQDQIVKLVCSGGASGGTDMLVYLPGGSEDAVEMDYFSDAQSDLDPGRADVIDTITIGDDSMLIDAYVRKSGDPTCCPTGKVDIRYEFGAGGPVFASVDEK